MRDPAHNGDVVYMQQIPRHPARRRQDHDIEKHIKEESSVIRRLAGCVPEGPIRYVELKRVKDDPTLQQLVWDKLMAFYDQHAPLQHHYCAQFGATERTNHVLCALNNGVHLYLRP